MVENEEILAHDLRQKYAEIVGVHLEAVSLARINNNYPSYFEGLENLNIVVEHKFSSKKKERLNKQKLNDIEYYNLLLEEAIKVINEYSTAYLGKTHDPNEIYKIKRALHNIEKFFYKVLDEAKVFGTKWDNDGL